MGAEGFIVNGASETTEEVVSGATVDTALAPEHVEITPDTPEAAQEAPSQEAGAPTEAPEQQPGAPAGAEDAPPTNADERARFFQSKYDKMVAAAGGMDPEALAAFKQDLERPEVIQTLQSLYTGQLHEGQPPVTPPPAAGQQQGTASAAPPTVSQPSVPALEKITLPEDEIHDEATLAIAAKYNQLLDAVAPALALTQQVQQQQRLQVQQQEAYQQMAASYMALGASQDEAVAIAQALLTDQGQQEYMRQVLAYQRAKAQLPVNPVRQPATPTVDPSRLEQAREQQTLPPSGAGASGTSAPQTGSQEGRGFLFQRFR